MVFSLNKSLCPSSSMQHAVKCSFLHEKSVELVVAKGNRLCVYSVYSALQGPGQRDTRLSLAYEFVLQGIATSVQVLGRRLLLTFADAKMSVVEFSSHSLHTVSLHHYEQLNLRDLHPAPLARADHHARCAVLLFHRDSLAVLPSQSSQSDLSAQPFLPSFVLELKDIDPAIANVIDFNFLYGFLEPTLAILYEPHQTFVGLSTRTNYRRLAARKDTISLIVVSLNLAQKSYPILYKVDRLPYNCTHIEPCPNPLGGILIFSHNALIHVDQTHTPGLCAIVNPFFDLESHFEAIPTTDGTPTIPVKNPPPSDYIKFGKTTDNKSLGISLDGCHSTFINPDTVIVILRTGEMLKVEFIGDEGVGRGWKRKRGGVKQIEFKRLDLITTIPSCVVSLLDFTQIHRPQPFTQKLVEDGVNTFSSYFFVGSCISDAMLIQYFDPLDEATRTEDVDMDDELDAELYGTQTATKTHKSIPPISLKICDSVLVTGPLRDTAIGPAPPSPFPYASPGLKDPLEIVCCGGYDTQGALVVLHESITPQIVSSFPLQGVEDIWTVSLDSPFHSYVVMSQGGGTSVLKAGDELEEVNGDAFYSEGPTVSVGTLLDSTKIAQVYPNGIILLDSGTVSFLHRWHADT